MNAPAVSAVWESRVPHVRSTSLERDGCTRRDKPEHPNCGGEQLRRLERLTGKLRVEEVFVEVRFAHTIDLAQHRLTLGLSDFAHHHCHLTPIGPVAHGR